MNEPRTRLEAFMRANDLASADLATEACMCERDLAGIVSGETMTTLGVVTAMRIRDACGRLLTRYVRMNEVFEVD
jgi:hypothetical protein